MGLETTLRKARSGSVFLPSAANYPGFRKEIVAFAPHLYASCAEWSRVWSLEPLLVLYRYVVRGKCVYYVRRINLIEWSTYSTVRSMNCVCVCVRVCVRVCIDTRTRY